MICFSLDTEQWNSPLLRGKQVSENDNTDFSRIGNENLLKLFGRHGVKTTFFVTSFFAEREKEHIEVLESEGHEIACHGHHHFYRGNANLDVETDVKQAKQILDKVTKQKVIGFRAPQMQYSKKLISVLKNEGFSYDSSLNPAYFPFWINNRNEPLTPYDDKGVIEIPVGATPKIRFPLSWMFIRIFPYAYLKQSVKALIKANVSPVLYVHSWEFMKLKSKHVPTYFRINTGEPFLKKMDRLISDFGANNFGTMKEIFTASR